QAAYAAAQAALVAHVAAHDLGAAAYAIKAARAAAPAGEGESAGRRECRWQRDQLPAAIRALVLDDQRLRNDICWSVFDCWAGVGPPGTQKLLFVLAGVLTLRLDDRPLRVPAGHGARLPGDRPHSYENRDEQPLHFVGTVVLGTIVRGAP